MPKLIAGKKKHNNYKGIELEDIVNKTIEAVTVTNIKQEYGTESLFNLLFTNGTKHGFVVRIDNDED